MTVACMTAEEEAEWRGEGYYAVAIRVRPCLDCPLSFALEMRAVGCCNGSPGVWGTRLQARPPGRRGPAPRYVTEEERREARRATWRESKRRHRA